MTILNNVKHIKFPVVEDTRGNLAFIQNDILPFEIKRIYYLFDVPSNAFRGGHSHINQEEILVALSGSFEVTVNDGNSKKSFLLNKPNIGLHISTGIWRELENFSSGAVCLVIASDVFKEEDYIRDFDEFRMSKK
ncbi:MULTISPECIES: sugar 3,4-ketoisomerase [Flavobacterium]|uniref:TDP-4-oxo-6-deoxy-alpha-D-glucose-3, 4-oxoisomerase n=2 Tax=Flavobacterium TaxID=237 RepID=A0A6V6Z679_9FLAO|nr:MULTISPECIES: FdtA/QdtA family cupin domain-containing protein [Flavobacterium]CAD0005963.1 TDP-4-oxo-6-deoxy-alpha-D-glucose-3, 4-oxoisomerase [Flavobacterium salmonis]CAD0007099.1 TDP-4-oxo-6-deoxy-alpha-D-glucose-3, 4-oxoisomerase [Flavobacterium chungangense]